METKKKFKSLHRHRIVQHGLAFDFTGTAGEGVYSVNPIGSPNNTEERTYEIQAPLLCTISVTHLESKRRDTVIMVYPNTKDYTEQQENDVIVFPTHVVVNRSMVILTLNNVQMDGGTNVPIWVPAFNLAWFMNRESGGRYRPLRFLRSDEMRNNVDLALVPQRTRITAKPAGGITSSRCPKLLGYFPGPDTPFTGWRAVAVRFGKIYESVAALMYLRHHPTYVFHEIGFLSLGEGLDGAQPDGRITDGETGVEFLMEIKCSRNSCDFEGYHLAQCVWELACGFPYLDLVRFCEKQVKRNGRWFTEYECREIRIHRDEELEVQVIKLCRHPDPAQAEQLRNRLNAWAAECNQKSTIIPVDVSAIERLTAYKRDMLSVPVDAHHPVMDRLEKRQADIFALFQEEDRGGTEFIRTVMDQIQDYAELVKDQ